MNYKPKFLEAFGALAVLVLFNAAALVTLYRWFLVPIGAPAELGIPHMIGVVCMVHVLFPARKSSDGFLSARHFRSQVFKGLGGYALFVSIGWVAHVWIAGGVG